MFFNMRPNTAPGKPLQIFLRLPYCQPKVSTLSDSSTNFSISFMVEIGHRLLPPLCLDFKHVPQANIWPLPSMNEPVCSFTLYFSSLMSSISTPFPIRNTFTSWPAFSEATPNLKAFQTVSGSFVLTTIPNLMLLPSKFSSKHQQFHLLSSFFISSYCFLVISP